MARMKSKKNGFTLAELLVATILLSIVMTAVYTLCNAVISAWRAVEEDYDAYQDARIAFTILQREINSLLNSAGFLFEGADDEFTAFIVSEPMNVDKTEGRHLLRVRYYHNSKSNELMREEAIVVKALPQSPDEDEMTGGRLRVQSKETFVVATGVRRFRLQYVWVPREEERDPRKPPKPEAPIIVDRHEKKWRLGMPNAIQVTLSFQDRKRSAAEPLRLKTTIPVPTQYAAYTRRELMSRLKDVAS